MALDPAIPNDLKKKVPDAVGSQAVRAGVMRNTLPNAMYPQPSPFDSVRGGSTSVPANTIPATPDAVNAGPPTVNLGVRDVIDPSGKAPVQTRMPSALDASAPLPAGVRQYASDGYHGKPGTNDVIYAGTDRFGNPSFSNNQFSADLRRQVSAGSILGKRGVSSDASLDALSGLRSAEIGRSVAAQTDAANAAANAAALAPRSIDDLAKLAKIKSDALAAGDAHAGAQADVAGKVGSNINNDVYTKAANESATALIGRGVDPGEAQRRGSIDAAARALAAGEDPSNPRLAPAARGGYTEGLRELANIVNTAPPRVNTSGGDLGIIPALFPAFDKSGTVVNPDKTDAGDYSIDQTLGQKFLSGPPDEHGVRRHVLLNDDQADRLSPLINFRKSKRKPLISDSK